MNGSITIPAVSITVSSQSLYPDSTESQPATRAAVNTLRPVRRALTRWLCAVLALNCGATMAWAQSESDAASIQNEQVYPAHLASAALVLDAIQAGNRYVAVGERGHVLLSDDGREWRQATQVPTRSNLTAVYFRGGQLWAVGHDSVILHSADLGESWNLQYRDAEAEQPLMDVLFTDAKHGIAVGAYNLIMRTEDGGQHWEVSTMADLLAGEIGAAEALASDDDGADDDYDDADVADDDALDEGDDDEFADEESIEYHLNAILDLGDERLLIAAEAGNGYRSDDAGASWYHFSFPYPGSMFGLIAEDANCVLAYGLRGHVQRSCDFADHWQQLESKNQSSLFGATTENGGITLVGANGALVRVRQGSDEAHDERLDSGEDLAAVLTTPNGLVVAGEDGLSMAFEGAAADGGQP